MTAFLRSASYLTPRYTSFSAVWRCMRRKSRRNWLIKGMQRTWRIREMFGEWERNALAWDVSRIRRWDVVQGLFPSQRLEFKFEYKLENAEGLIVMVSFYVVIMHQNLCCLRTISYANLYHFLSQICIKNHWIFSNVTSVKRLYWEISNTSLHLVRITLHPRITDFAHRSKRFSFTA